MNCRETCGWCPKCEDLSLRCPSRMYYCLDPANKDFMKTKCRKTCGYCTVPTTAPTLPPTPTWKVIPAGQCGVPKIQSSRVINGVDANKGTWPWQVLIRFMDDAHCGGSIISPFWVVTAAHCVEGKEPLMKDFKVITGDHDFNVDEGTETEIGVSKIIVHKNYTRSRLDSDIALIKLNRPVPFGQFVGTVCLPEKIDTVPLGTECFITGWGKIDPYNGLHHKLQQAKLPVVANDVCKALNTNSTRIPVTERMVCAGHGPLTPTGGCHGDSGGPFVCKTGRNGEWVLHGAVSWGSGRCDTTEAYTLFARISSLRGWIDEQTTSN